MPNGMPRRNVRDGARGWRAVFAKLATSLVVCLALTPAAQASVAWLSAQQAADGSFASNTATTFQATTEVLITLGALGVTPPDLPAALSYIAANADPETASTEYLARRILAEAAMGVNVDALVDELLARQNGDGGFGDGAGYSSSLLDTAFAVGAIYVSAGYSDAVQVANVYLLARQKASGAWHADDEPSTYLTALVAHALWYSRHDSELVPPSLVLAQTYLIAARDGAGSWGEAFEDALSLLHLLPSIDSRSSIEDSIVALRSARLFNESWGNDSYVTSLALRTLHWADMPVSNPDMATIRGTVLDGATALPLHGASVVLTGAENRALTIEGDGAFEFIGLAPGAYSLEISFPNYGGFTAATRLIHGEVWDFGAIRLVKATTATTGILRGVVTDYATGLPVEGAAVLAAGTTTPVFTAADGSYQISNARAGYYSVSVTRQGYLVASSAIQVYGGGVAIFSPKLLAGVTPDTVVTGIVVDGQTAMPLTGVLVTVSDNLTSYQAVTDTNGRYEIHGVTTGVRTITSVLSSYDTVTRRISIPENNVTEFSPLMWPTGTTPAGSNTSGVTGVVLDAGTGQPLPNVTVRVYDGTVSKFVQTDATGRFTAEGFLSYSGIVSVDHAGYKIARATINFLPLHIIDMGELRLQPDVAEVLLPDLAVENADRSATAVDLSTLSLSGVLVVDVINKGSLTTDVPASITAFHDANLNGVLDEGDAVLGSTDIPAHVTVGGIVRANMALSGSLPYRDAPIHLWLDSGERVPELNEENNVEPVYSRYGCVQKSTVPIQVPKGYFAELFAEQVSNQQGPTQMDFDSQDNLYIGTGSSPQIIKIPAGSNVPEPFGQTCRGDTDGVVVDDQDNVIVSDNCVAKYAPDGPLIWESPYISANVQNIATDKDGYVYVGSTGPNIYKISPDGQTVVALGPWQVPGRSYMPSDSIAVGPDNMLYFGIGTKGIGSKIYRTTLNGENLELVVEGWGSLGLTFDANGDLFAANYPEIFKVSLPDKTPSVFASGFAGNAISVAINSKGDFYVGELNSWNIYRIAIAGLYDTSASYLRLVDNGTGQPVSLIARIGNSGGRALAAGQVSFYQGDPAAGGILLGTVPVSPLAPGTWEDVRLDNVALTNGDDLYAVVDNGNALEECNEDNNVVSLPLAAAPVQGALAVSTNQSEYGPNTPVQITAQLTNTGSLAGSYQVAMQVEDVSGAIVAVLPTQLAEAVTPGVSTSLVFDWNTGLTLTGSYRIRSTLRGLDGSVISEVLTPFVIAPYETGSTGASVSLSSASDKAAYHTTDQAVLDHQVRNLTANEIVSGAILNVTVLDPNGLVVSSTSSPLGELVPGAIRNIPVTVALSGAAEGAYRVQSMVLAADGQTVLASAVSEFAVQSDVTRALTATVAAAIAEVEAGQSQTCTATLTNIGSVNISSLALRQALVNIDSGQMLQEAQSSLSLAAGQATTRLQSWSTAGLASGNYACIVQVMRSGVWESLGYAAFTVTAPPITLEGEIREGDQGRVLVWLEPGEGDSCEGVTQLKLRTAFSPALAANATARIVLLNKYGTQLDSEFVDLASFTAPLNQNSSSSSADLSVDAMDANGMTVALNATGSKLGYTYRVIATVNQGGTSQVLDSGSIDTRCEDPIYTGKTEGAYTISGLSLIAPTDPSAAPSLEARRNFIKTLLGDAGWSVSLVHDDDDFERGFYSGAYQTYLMLGKQDELDSTVQKALREAVFRGEGVIYGMRHGSGDYESSSSGSALELALGVDIKGYATDANQAVVNAGDWLANGATFGLATGERVTRMSATSAQIIGTLLPEGSCSGSDGEHDSDHEYESGSGDYYYKDGYYKTSGDDGYESDSDSEHDSDHESGDGSCTTTRPALTLNDYGRGRGITVGFDLLRQAMAAGSDSEAAQLLAGLVQTAQPSLMESLAGGVLPIDVIARNTGQEADVRATLTLPAGTTVVDGGEAGINGNLLTWTLTIPASTQASWRFWSGLPEAAGPVTFSASLEGALPGSGAYQLLASPSLTLDVHAAATIPDVRAALDALLVAGTGSDYYLEKARYKLGNAELYAETNPTYAFRFGLEAADKLIQAGNHPDIDAARRLLDEWLWSFARTLPAEGSS